MSKISDLSLLRGPTPPMARIGSIEQRPLPIASQISDLSLLRGSHWSSLPHRFGEICDPRNRIHLTLHRAVFE
jgi:hypothetical protein